MSDSMRGPENLGSVPELTAEDRQVVAAWLKESYAEIPAPARALLALHLPVLVAKEDQRSLRRAYDAVCRELRRVLHLTPSSEKRRTSGSPLAGIPKDKASGAKNEREKLEARISRATRLADWHCEQKRLQAQRAKKLKERLAKMPKDPIDDRVKRPINEESPPEDVEDIELTEEDRADVRAASARFVEHLTLGGSADPALKSVNETLMPAGAVLVSDERVNLAATVPPRLTDAQVIKTINEQRVRFDFSVCVTRVELNVEKKVLVDPKGDRFVVSASTADYGPPRFQVTWSALVTLTILVGQFAMPFHRLATMLSTPEKRFSASALSRMLHYVARRLVPIYLELARQVADSEILAGDDTSCRVLDVSTYRAKLKAGQISRDAPAPWADYRTPRVAEEILRRCEVAQRSREERRESGDRDATRTSDETPSLGVLIGRKLVFESPLRSGDGPKEAMHTTVISGRSVADDPTSLIVFYRSHIGSYGNLLESILQSRDPGRRRLTVQGDLSTTNLVASPELLARFEIRNIGCSAHARRPFAIHEQDDPMGCSQMLHLFLGLAIHEGQLDVFGRNRENVLAVRGQESRELWNDIRELATEISETWSTGTQLGTGARYIISHFEELTAYLDDHRLEPSNNLRERMLRTEKLIEGSSMFRRSLEGRFALDVVRTINQTAVAAGAPVQDYLDWVLRANEDEVAREPSRFTPRARVAIRNANAPPTAPP